MPNVANIVQQLRASSVLTTSRILLYASVSTAAVSAVVLHAFANHNNFYSAAVYMSRSSRSVLILVNFAVLLAFLMGRIMQQTFFGPLRHLETERLYDRLWFFLTESLLAFTIFRDEFDVVFGIMFGSLLFIKCFHWLMADRIEWMDQIPYPGPGMLFRIRFLALFAILSLTDIIMLAVATESIMMHGVGAIVLFGNEYAIMLANAANCLAKYVVYSYDQRRAGRNGGENAPVWEQKSMYIFYIELVTDFLKLVTYMVFFILILTFYGLPLNIIRDVYITARSFYQRCRDLARYLDATKNMDQRYPDATQADLNEMSDKTCIICREELVQQNESAPGGHEGHQQNQGPNMSPKKLSCGHIFHFHCLRSWLERQQSCPTCRRSVLETGDATQSRPAQPVVQPNNNGAVPGAVANRDAPVATPTPTTNNNVTPSSERSQQRSRRHRWANELPGFQAGPLKPPPRFEGFNVGPGDWQPWGHLSSPRRPRTEFDEDAEPSSEPSSSGVDPGDQPSTNPRGNAALAALRRLGSGNGLGVVEPSLERQATSPSSNRPSLNGHALDKGKAPMRLLSEQRLASLSRAQELGIPPMIPLFDPSLQLASETNSSHQPTPTMSPSSTSMLSREVIDERLRSLNNIQDTLLKSAEELLKLKSLLPSSSPSVEQSLAASASDIQQPTLSTRVELDRATESESYPSEDD